MADNLTQKSHKSSDKTKYNNVIHRTTSESLRLSDSEKGVSHPTSLQASAHNPRKISSFQITSVTVGSRVSTDAGEDSADDLDESHTDDISRVTDLENETPSFSEDTFSKDDVFYNASSASLGCAPVIPTSSQYGLAIVGQEPGHLHTGPASHACSDVSDINVSVTSSGAGSIINIIGNSKPQEGMKEIQEHVRNERFKVVKIESTEPFRRGRWLCMDYLDHTTTQQSAPIIVNNSADSCEAPSTLAAPDSGVVLNDSQHEDTISSTDLTNKQPKDVQQNANLQTDHNAMSFPIASPGQSLTQPINVVQQSIAPTQSVSVQSPPLEMQQQIPNQNLQTNQQVSAQHPQSMSHIAMNTQPAQHPPPAQSQPVQQMPQSFPQHQLQQVITQTQMQQMPIHQPMPQQMQNMQSQAQMQQMQGQQHLSQNQPQMSNMQQMQQMPNQQIPQMQSMQPQSQMQANQQTQMQQLQIQQMQGQQNQPQLHQLQQPQMNNLNQQHHLQNQAQSMSSQQPQLQHMQSQGQMHTMQNQQMSNHLQQMQIPTQVSQLPNQNQQMTQMQPQMHQMSSQQAGGQQGQVVQQHAGMHGQMQQSSLPVQQQYSQSIPQQASTQNMMQPGMVQQYHTQQSQMSQPGQSLSQEVMSNITTSQQGSTMPNNLQSMSSQPPGTTLPSNLQGMSNQQQSTTIHTINQQAQSMPQGAIQMMTQPSQNMPMSMDNNQGNMQIPVSDPIYIQSTVSQQMAMAQHMPQTQNMMSQQVQNTAGQSQPHMQQQGQIGIQYVMPQQQNISNQAPVASQSGVVSQQPIMQTMVNQNVVQHGQSIPMPMQQSLPVSMQQGSSMHTVASSAVQTQNNMPTPVAMPMGSYNTQSAVGSIQQNVMPNVISQNMSATVMEGHVNPPQAVSQISGTNSPVVSMPAGSTVSYPSSQATTTNALDGQSFGSPVSAVVSQVVNSLVNSSVGLTTSDSGALEVLHNDIAGDMSDGKDDHQMASTEDESFSGLAMALGGSATPSAEEGARSTVASGPHSRAPSPSPAAPATTDQQQPEHHTSASGASAVAIDNKIEQAMDLVKSHLMFAVREEVEVLKERIAELMERISQLELENTYLRAHASPDTIAHLQAQAHAAHAAHTNNKVAGAQPPANPGPPVS